VNVPNLRRHTNAEVVEALEEPSGNITRAGKLLGLARETLHRRIRDDDELMRAVVSNRRVEVSRAEDTVSQVLAVERKLVESLVDMAERGVPIPPDAIPTLPNTWRYLRYMGQTRERIDVHVSGRVDVKHTVDLKAWSTEDLERLVELRQREPVALLEAETVQ
jgi:hypothetical protein